MLVLAAVVCGSLSGCSVGAREHEQLAGSGPWTRWEVTPADEFGGAFTLIYINSIVPRNDTEPWTAVGYTVGLGGERRPRLWTSHEGVSWRTEDLPSSSSSVRWDRPFFAARRGEALVVFGLRGESGAEGVVAWRRTETSGWSVLTDVNSNVYAIPETVEEIVAGPKSFIAVGARHTQERSDIHVLRSEDGARWSGGARTGIVGGSDERFIALGFAVGPEAEVIVGSSWPFTPPHDDKDGAIWWARPESGDWTFVPVGAAAGPGYDAVSDVAPFGKGFVAVGVAEVPEARPMAWVSRDGQAWTARRIEEVEGSALSVAVVGNQLVAAGIDRSGLVAWTSLDGHIWTRLELPKEMTHLDRLDVWT